MKKFFSKLTLALAACTAFLASCDPAEEVKPNASKPNVTVSFAGADYGVQQNMQLSTTVSTTGDTAFINLTVNGTTETNKIFMTYQKDNEKAEKFTKFPDGTSINAGGYLGTDLNGANGEKFNYSNGTFNIKSDISKAFKITIPVLLRKTAGAKSDVFQLWITQKGKSGSHDNPAKNLAYGVATITLNYTNEALINNYETVLGSSKNDTIGSLFSTSTGSNYFREYAQVTLNGAGIDFVFNNFTSGKFSIGSFYSDATNTNADVTAGFGAVSNIKRVIKIAETTTAAWDNAVGESSVVSAVDAISASTFTSFKTYNSESDFEGKVFAFITADNKKGLIKVISVDNADTNGGSASLQVKVQR